MNKNIKYLSILLILIIMAGLTIFFLNPKKEKYDFTVKNTTGTISSDVIYARIIGDSEICKKIESESDKKFCIENAKAGEIIAKANSKDDEKICNSINEEKKKDYCVTFVKTKNIRQSAVNKNSEIDCKKINDPLIKQRCLLLVSTNEIRKKAIINDNINFCKEGKNNDEVTICEGIYYYYKNTVKNKDKEGCNELLLDEIKNLCLENIN